MNESVSLSAEELERTKPAGWEYLLFAAVLEEEIVPVLDGYEALRWQHPSDATPALGALESREYALEKRGELQAAVARLTVLLEDHLARVWGAPGRPPDAVAIRRACQHIVAGCKGFLVWERALRSVEPHPLLERAFTRLRGVTKPWVEQVAALAPQFRNVITVGRSGTLEFDLRFDIPSLADLKLPSPEDCSRAGRAAGITNAANQAAGTPLPAWSVWDDLKEGLEHAVGCIIGGMALAVLACVCPVVGWTLIVACMLPGRRQ